jgi:hypothetical protein
MSDHYDEPEVEDTPSPRGAPLHLPPHRGASAAAGTIVYSAGQAANSSTHQYAEPSLIQAAGASPMYSASVKKPAGRTVYYEPKLAAQSFASNAASEHQYDEPEKGQPGGESPPPPPRPPRSDSVGSPPKSPGAAAQPPRPQRSDGVGSPPKAPGVAAEPPRPPRSDSVGSPPKSSGAAAQPPRLPRSDGVGSWPPAQLADAADVSPPPPRPSRSDVGGGGSAPGSPPPDVVRTVHVGEGSVHGAAKAAPPEDTAPALTAAVTRSPLAPIALGDDDSDDGSGDDGAYNQMDPEEGEGSDGYDDFDVDGGDYNQPPPPPSSMSAPRQPPVPAPRPPPATATARVVSAHPDAGSVPTPSAQGEPRPLQQRAASLSQRPRAASEEDGPPSASEAVQPDVFSTGPILMTAKLYDQKSLRREGRQPGPQAPKNNRSSWHGGPSQSGVHSARPEASSAAASVDALPPLPGASPSRGDGDASRGFPSSAATMGRGRQPPSSPIDTNSTAVLERSATLPTRPRAASAAVQSARGSGTLGRMRAATSATQVAAQNEFKVMLPGVRRSQVMVAV